MPRRRADATLAKDVPNYRRIMPFIMPGRNESAVYFDQEIDLTRTEPFLAKYNDLHPDARATLFHLVLWASVRTLHERPRLNRFVAGGKLWQRDGIWVSFSAKKRKDDDSPIVVLKRRLDPEQSFEDLVSTLHGDVQVGRSNKKSTTDKELSAVLRLPTGGVRALLAAGRALDGLGLLPAKLIESDPMYASMFIANLGSLKMDAAYHHLYEYGNIPIFCVIGRSRETPAVVDGQIVAKRIATLRYTYDERVEDGLYAQRALERLRTYVEDPEAAGGLAKMPDDSSSSRSVST